MDVACIGLTSSTRVTFAQNLPVEARRANRRGGRSTASCQLVRGRRDDVGGRRDCAGQPCPTSASGGPERGTPS